MPRLATGLPQSSTKVVSTNCFPYSLSFLTVLPSCEGKSSYKALSGFFSKFRPTQVHPSPSNFFTLDKKYFEKMINLLFPWQHICMSKIHLPGNLRLPRHRREANVTSFFAINSMQEQFLFLHKSDNLLLFFLHFKNIYRAAGHK